MAASNEEFRDLLMEHHVDLNKIKARAVHGIPDGLRGEVWKYLLDVSKPDKSEEASLQKEMQRRYSEFDKTNLELVRKVRGEIKRYQPRVEFFRQQRHQEVLERAVLAFTNHNTYIEYVPGMISLLGPFVHGISNEAEVYFCFQSFVERLEQTFPKENTQSQVANFVALFKALLPELHASFDQEEVEPGDWMVSWIRFLLCRELPLTCVLRLWDTYLASDDGMSLHVYVCLAILQYLQDDLLELNEGVEILSALQHLPVLEMDQIVTRAQFLQRDVMARELV
mmetsp:Transcript_32147/g.73636  ORF Transcript_32147/g.73636 Transcript_32147/m.73636 type:complete len:282 (-) Transcript_32147:399-1244(-)|eukprot:CAMPEP_0114560908 /NCGR_PEP_ID=MMETSP0114-20121206/11718_1 /TAXON_ID=31324 /ORGANISM="Goniomonas sp, Strain m" /LENGTH=281 /DNA_ID=CAMNT_0001746501 /DNA_START=112 /DNA_END=957 /DNA_ORIENTATION=-